MNPPSAKHALAGLARLIAVIAVVLAPVAAAVAPGSPSVTVTASPATVVPGNKVNLTAAMPVSDAGTISQQILMQIDPTKVKLTSPNDVIAPAGWTITYCSTTCNAPPANFTATPPATPTAWAAVKAVRAVGTVNSQGAYQGRQIAARTATMAIPASGPFSSSGNGDGWSVFFDDRGYVFNVFHHQAADSPQVDCRDRNGVSCGANWPFGQGTGVGYTSYVSNGWYDPVYKHIWFDATRTYDVVFECIDVTDITTPKMCGGSPATTFVRTGVSLSPIAGTPNYGSYGTWKTRGIAQAGGRVFSQTYGTTNGVPMVTCVDTRANGGLGARCPGSPLAPIPGQVGDYTGAIAAIAGKIWATGSRATSATEGEGGLMCFEPDTLQACAGSWPQTWTMATPGSLIHVFEIPTAAGGLGGVCVTTAKCFSLTGSPVTLNSGLASWYDSVGDTFGYAEHALRQGPRLYMGNGNGAAGSFARTFSCWDQSRNAGAGGVCPNWPVTTFNYGIALDPLNDNCVWKNDHRNEIKAYDTITATSGCLTPPSKVVIPADVAVPRMACSSAASGVREWRSIQLMAPAASGYTSAKLTILDSSGNAIPGWVDVAFDPASSRLIDLASLTVATTGQKPTFIVQYTGLTSATNTSVEVVAVGDAPEMCLTPEAISTCPISPAPGQIPDSPANGSFAVLGDGSATTGSGTISYGQGSTTVTVGAGPSPSCSSSMAGQALSNDGSALPVAGVTVTLLNSSGTVLNWPAGSPNAGQPMTATTDSNGNYSFPLLSPGTYKVKFNGTATQTAKNARVIASSTGPGASGDYATGSGTAAASTVTSTSTSISVSGPGMVNGYFNRSAVGVADTSTGGAGQAQTASLTANDMAATGNTMTASSVYLCPAGSPGPYNASTCTLRPTVGSPLSVAGVGTYSLNATTGVVTFTPVAGYSGTPAALQYIASDSAGNVVNSTYTPTVVPPPTVTANTSTGNWDTNQSISVLGNDTASTGATLTPSTVKLCPTNASSPYTASNCNQTSVTVLNEGTYTANADGTVTFDPLPSFTGTVATPVRYLVQDSLSQVGSALITPTVNMPAAPQATPEQQAVRPGATATFTSVLTGPSALATGSGLKSGASGGPCLIDPADSQCKTTFAITGEGTWSIDQTTGVATFAADPAATPGTKTPVTYRVTDAVGQTATSTLTPVIPPPPSASPDISSGNWDVNQVITILGNDSASTPATIDTGSVKICTTATATNSCTGSTLSITGQGTYTVNNSGTVTFDPLPSFAGQATPIKYVVQDSSGQVATSTITPTVLTPAAPQATPEQRAVLPGSTVSFTSVLVGGGALATGSGLQAGTPNGPCLVSGGSCVTSLTIAGEGTWSINQATGVAQFAADPAATTGTKTPVTYRVTDALGRTATSTLTPVIPPPPTGVPDTSVGVVGAQQVSKVVANDLATSPATISASTVALCPVPTPSPITAAACNLTSLAVTGEGTYTAITSGPNAGSISFTPTPSFTGFATPRPYVVLDSVGQMGTSTYTPQVVSIPAPSATPDSTMGVAGATQMVNPLTNDAPGSADYPLSGSTVRLCGPSDVAPTCTETTLTTSDGVFSVNPLTGFISFQPVSGMLGTAAAVTYAVRDTAGQLTSSTYAPRVVGVGPPQVSPATVSVAHGAPGTMSPQVTPGSAAIDTSKTCLAAPGGTCTPGDLSLILPEGTYALDPATGVVTFTPARGYSGTPADPPLLCVTDLAGQGACATLTPTVAPPPAPPEQPSGGESGTPLPGAPVPSALPEVESTMAGQPVTLRPLVNDSPSSGAMLDPSSVRIRDPRTLRYSDEVIVPGQGTFRVTPNGSVTFTPQPGFVGTTPAITYRVTDSLGRTATSTITVIVRDTPPPWADPQFNQAMRGRPVAFDPVAANSAGSSPFVPSSVRIQDPVTGAWSARVVVRGEGTWTVDPQTGKVRFAPLPSFVGSATPLNYRIANARGQMVRSTLHPLIRDKRPALSIATRASHTTLRPGQRSLITLRIDNHGLATTTRTITRAPIPKGFAVANPMGGTVRGGWIWFTTGNLRPGGGTTRRFVLVATSSGVGQGTQQVTGWATSTNTRSVNDPTALRVIGAVGKKAPVTG